MIFTLEDASGYIRSTDWTTYIAMFDILLKVKLLLLLHPYVVLILVNYIIIYDELQHSAYYSKC